MALILALQTFSEQADIPANEIFGEQEIKILLISSRKLKVTVPKEMTISMAVLIIARMGGFLARKNDGNPGMEVLWKGWKKFNDRCEFIEELTYG